LLSATIVTVIEVKQWLSREGVGCNIMDIASSIPFDDRVILEEPFRRETFSMDLTTDHSRNKIPAEWCYPYAKQDDLNLLGCNAFLLSGFHNLPNIVPP